MGATNNWFERVMKRLPLTQPGTLVASNEGVGVFLGNWAGNVRVFGVLRGGRVVVELYPTAEDDWTR